MRTVGNYNAVTAVVLIKSKSIVENAVHLSHDWKRTTKTLQFLDYSRVVTSLSLFPAGRTLLTTSLDLRRVRWSMHIVWENNRPLMLCVYHNSVAVMKRLVDKYSQPGELVYDPLVGLYATGRAFVLL